MASLPDPLEHRQADHPIEELFLRRWSPRSMSGEALAIGTLHQLLEAARWAPSSYNEQEWRFLYAFSGTSHWAPFFELLMEANQQWCSRAGALLLVLSKKTFARNGKPNSVHSLDTGMAVQNLLLQATSLGLVGHPMAGFNRSQARQSLNIPDDFEIECMVALGYPGNPDQLPADYRSAEVPTGRKPITEISCEGSFAL